MEKLLRGSGVSIVPKAFTRDCHAVRSTPTLQHVTAAETEKGTQQEGDRQAEIMETVELLSLDAGDFDDVDIVESDEDTKEVASKVGTAACSSVVLRPAVQAS
eukprot:g13769.t1